MVNQKVVDAASQAAAANIGELMTSFQNRDGNEPTVYYQVFHNTLAACGISREEMQVRVDAYAEKYHAGVARAASGNLMKEASNQNMGQKIFIKLMKALFPAQ